MSARYVITDRPWFTEREELGVELQTTDLLDTRTGTTYADGAYRVLDAEGRKVGKIFKGETAYDYGASLFRETVTAALTEEWYAHRAYRDACHEEQCEAFDIDMWRVQGRPEGPLG